MTNSDRPRFETIDEVIESTWTHFYPEFSSAGHPGFEVEALLSESDRRNNSDHIEVLSNWLKLFDEFLRWHISFCWAMTAHLKDHRADYRCRTFCALSHYVVSQHIAIRRLVLAGLDAQAKQLVRPLAEHLDLMVLLAVAPELDNEFRQTDDEKASNRFWHTYIAKGKARRMIKQKLAEQTSLASNPEIEGWRLREEAVLSMTIHPSILACHMAALAPGAEEKSFWPPCLGAKSDTSVRTLSYAIMASVEFLSYGYEKLFHDTPPIFSIDVNISTHRHIEKGQWVLLSLILFLVKYQDWEPLAKMRSIDHWFEGEDADDRTI